MNHLLHPEADVEFLEELRHYIAISSELGDRVYEEISRLLRHACAHPHCYRMFDPSVRRLLATDFPHAVLHVAKADYAWIVAVAPFKRDPDYWKHRLTN